MKSKKIIGTDVSLGVCKGEGYMMMDTEGAVKLDPEKQYRVFCYCPSWVQEGTIAIDERISFNELLEIYNKHKSGIDSFADDMPSIMENSNDSLYDLLRAADTINMYCGPN